MRLIDADAMRDRLQNLAYDDWNQGASTSWADAYRECADMVEEMPTIEPERKTGHWKFDWKHNKATCSECRHTFRDAFDIDDFDNFCRHCGAYMREGWKE